MKIETEEKYYCMEPEKLIALATEYGFKKTKETFETDEYFTDIYSKFIKNRTCLRIRKKNNKYMESTYKGKSDSLLGQYCKLENNINASIENYKNYINLFSSLGYYSYVEVEKKRITYSLEEDSYQYSIMIDTLPEIGGFVEFEILTDQNKANKREIKKELENFIVKFSNLKLKEATEPYRDIVAKHKLTKITKGNSINCICVNLDGELLKYEKDFYKKYKDQMSKILGNHIIWGKYKNNKQLDINIDKLIIDYLDDLIFTNNELLVTMELMKQISYEKLFVTKVNPNFVKCFFNKMGLTINNILYVSNNDSLLTTLKKNKVSLEHAAIINHANFKENNSILLILINESK